MRLFARQCQERYLGRAVARARYAYALREVAQGRRASGYVFDILEPHDPSRKDNYPKAAGMAKFANDHGGQFDRIQLIRKEKGSDGREHFYRLDMGRLEVRNKVRGVTSNEELDRIFGECKVVEGGEA